MSATVTPSFRKGGALAQEADERTGGGNFRKVHWFPDLGKGNQIFVRFITDSPEWIYVKQHTGAPTKNAPSDWDTSKRKWPETMPATCRYDEAFAGLYSDCYICDAKLTNKWDRVCKPTGRVWALAVLREEVIGTKAMADAGTIPANKVGKRVGLKDATREVAKLDAEGKVIEGETETELAIVVVNKATKNFFNGLQVIYGAYDTVCDRDILVQQTGEGKDVVYNMLALDPTPNLAPGTEKWAKYEEAVEAQKLNLEELIADRASDDYFARFFDPNKTPAKKDGDNDQEDSGPVVKATSSDPDPERLAALRDRLRPNAAKAAETPDFD